MRSFARVTATICCLLMVFAVSLPTAGAQVLQLPAFSSSGVDTTVVVPDRGTALLSGGGRAAAGLSTFGGLPRARGWGVSRQAYSSGVSVWVHDHRAHDQGVADRSLQAPASPTPAMASGAQAAFDPAPVSAAALAASRADNAAARDNHARTLLTKGRQARQSGKTAVAEIYLRAAAREASGALREQIQAELSATSPPTTRSPLK